MTVEPTRVEREIEGHRLVLETGHVARQAHGSVVATLNGTKVFAAVVRGDPREGIDFFPLTVDYREKTESAGKIPGGFFKREGRPTTKEILTMRLTDRSIRPLFPEGYKDEVQVMSHVLSYDGTTNADVLSMIAAFAALRISGIPFHGSLGAVRIGHLDGRLVAFPPDPRRRGETRLDLVVAGHRDAICMVEASAREVTEAEMIDALELAHGIIRQVCEMLDELHGLAGKEPLEFVAPEPDRELQAAAERYREALGQAMLTTGKHARQQAVDALRDEFVQSRVEGVDDEREKMLRAKAAKGAFGDLLAAVEREIILSGRRVDGRAYDEIRDIWIVPDFIERQHGSALFTRGETQALVSVTLGTPEDEQIIDGIDEEYRKRFYLHYNFPPYSVGETRRIAGPGRREIGHGMLAERALEGVLPGVERFPYTIRIVSDILESNGSSSMATVCGGCLWLMLAGVPISQPVAGIAMGLIQEGQRTAILSDILGSEDHHGDMDFKVAGSGVGITALQMDIKIQGVTRELLERALEQARQGRIHVLRKMLEAVPQPSMDISQFAPRMESIRIPPEKIGYLIGPGGSNIKSLQERYKCKISIRGNEGDVMISGVHRELVQKCIDEIQGMCETPKIGARYTGTVKAVKDFGAFIEILPGVEGMCHISELADGYVDRVTDVVQVGETIEVVVINVDDRGKIKLSAKAALQGARAGRE